MKVLLKLHAKPQILLFSKIRERKNKKTQQTIFVSQGLDTQKHLVQKCLNEFL